MDFETGDPYVVRQFSEKLRQLMEAGLGRGKAPIFPQVGRMKAGIRSVIDDSIFGGIEVRLDTRAMRKRIILQVGEQSLPFMTWSAGQREFVPLLLGLYWLMPSTRASTRQGIEWVVVEEPEAGLHPQAVTSVLVTLLELIHRGYRVIVSTHSTQVVEMMWAIRVLSESSASPESLLKLLGLQRQSGWIAWAREIMTQKVFRTFFFERSGHAVTAKDISTLDPFDMDEAISDWGGLTSFSTRVSEVISNAVREAA